MNGLTSNGLISAGSISAGVNEKYLWGSSRPA
jgi:hypothetical protein